MPIFLTRRRAAVWICALLTLCVFALRAADVTGRSLWTDESFTLLRIDGSWAHMFTNTVPRQGVDTTDLHPPLYFALLKIWAVLAGRSDFALRYFSVFWVVLLLPLTVLFATRLHSQRAGLLAGLFVLTCPAMQWYGWEVRNYSIITVFAALNGIAALAWLRALRAGIRTSWHAPAVWAVTAVLGVFTHYTFLGFVVGQASTLLLANVRRIKPGKPWLFALAGLAGLAGLLVLTGSGGTLVAAFQIHVMPSLRQPNGLLLNPWDLVMDIAGAMQFGFSAADPLAGMLNIVFVMLCVLGGVVMRKRAAVLTGAILASIAMWWLLALIIPNRPSFRYFVAVVPLLYAYAVCAVLWLAGRIRHMPLRVVAAVSLTAMVLGPHTHGLIQTFTRKTTFEDDWRGVAQYLRDNWRDGDVVLINIVTPESVIEKYLRGLPVKLVSFGELARLRDSGQTSPAVLQSQYQRIWVANTGGMSDQDEAWWLTGVQKTTQQVFPGRTTIPQLALYPIARSLSADIPAQMTPTVGDHSGEFRLAGWQILDAQPYHQSTNFKLKLAWQRVAGTGPAAAVLRVTLRTDARVWHDVELRNVLAGAPSQWGTAGAQIFVDEYVVVTPPGLPALKYTLDLELQSDAQKRLQLASAAINSAERDCCIVLPGPAGPDFWPGDDVALARAEYPDRVRFGQPLPVVLTWRKRSASLGAWTTRLALEPTFGAAVATHEARTGEGESPVSAWPLNAWVRDMHALAVPVTAPPGEYRLTLARLRDGIAIDSVTLGNIAVEPYPASPVPTDITLPMRGTVGELNLLGLRLPVIERGLPVDIATLWRVDSSPRRDGVIFLHVISPDGLLAASDDMPPERGARSTQTYRAGDGIELVHSVTLPANAPPGIYKIYVGIYDRVGFDRWPATAAGAPAQDNVILVTSFELK